MHESVLLYEKELSFNGYFSAIAARIWIFFCICDIYCVYTFAHTHAKETQKHTNTEYIFIFSPLREIN